MTHPTTPFPPICDEGIPTGDGETVWGTWDAATWRLTAFDLLDVQRERAYLELDCKSIAQYADWVLGLLPGYAAELLRIADKLLDLPEIDRELCAGKLTWEQVVLLTRVAVPKHEYAWLDRALELSLEELTQLVERSAEGWAPPIAWSAAADARRVVGCETVDALDATSGRARAVFSRGATPPSGSRLGRAADGTAARSKIALCSPDAGRVRRLTIAPNVRQPFHPPPSTS